MKTVVEWNQGNVATLKGMWAARCSASQIAAAIPGATRNAVIGKTHRLGLGLTLEELRARRAAANSNRAPRRTGSRINLVFSRPVDLLEPSPEFRCTITGLGPRSCRFPIGEPQDESFCYCGHTTELEGVPYCAPHMARTHVPTRLTKLTA